MGTIRWSVLQTEEGRTFYVPANRAEELWRPTKGSKVRTPSKLEIPGLGVFPMASFVGEVTHITEGGSFAYVVFPGGISQYHAVKALRREP